MADYFSCAVVGGFTFQRFRRVTWFPAAVYFSHFPGSKPLSIDISALNDFWGRLPWKWRFEHLPTFKAVPIFALFNCPRPPIMIESAFSNSSRPLLPIHSSAVCWIMPYVYTSSNCRRRVQDSAAHPKVLTQPNGQVFLQANLWVFFRLKRPGAVCFLLCPQPPPRLKRSQSFRVFMAQLPSLTPLLATCRQ